jgi:GT2 family glycosyltransferase
MVDNGSIDNSVKLVRKHYPGVKIKELQRNLGFAGGVNAGISIAKGKWIVLLNQDVIMHPGWLTALLESFSDKKVGIVGGKLIYPDGRIQHAGGIINWPLGLPDHFGYGQLDNGQWDRSRSVDYVTGAVFGIRRSVLEHIGLFDEGFWPGYYEEVDYCFRARQAGWEVVYNPKCIGIHWESSSLGRGSKVYLEALHKGRLRFVLKHLSHSQLTSEFLPAEKEYLLNSLPLLRRVLRRVYLITLLSTIPDILECANQEAIEQIWQGFYELYLLALEANVPGKMLNASNSGQQLPTLQEFDFPSKVPVVGSLISLVRRFLYSLTAKWAVWFLIQQQNQINQIIGNWLREQESMLIDLDRDLALLARTVAEIEIRQRYLAKSVEAHRAADQTKRDA